MLVFVVVDETVLMEKLEILKGAKLLTPEHVPYPL